MSQKITLESIITCTECNHSETETMPTEPAIGSMNASNVAPYLNHLVQVVACFARLALYLAHLFKRIQHLVVNTII